MPRWRHGAGRPEEQPGDVPHRTSNGGRAKELDDTSGTDRSRGLAITSVRDGTRESGRNIGRRRSPDGTGASKYPDGTGKQGDDPGEGFLGGNRIRGPQIDQVQFHSWLQGGLISMLSLWGFGSGSRMSLVGTLGSRAVRVRPPSTNILPKYPNNLQFLGKKKKCKA